MVSMVTVVILVAGIWQIRLLRHSTEEQMQHNADRAMSAAVKVIDNRMATVEASVRQQPMPICWLLTKDRLTRCCNA